MKLLLGKPVAQSIEQAVLAELKKLPMKVGLAFIRVGELPASKAYIQKKKHKCQEVGIESYDFELPEHATQSDLHDLIQDLNKNPKVHGILLQLPLPKHHNTLSAIEKIDLIKTWMGFIQ